MANGEQFSRRSALLGLAAAGIALPARADDAGLGFDGFGDEPIGEVILRVVAPGRGVFTPKKMAVAARGALFIADLTGFADFVSFARVDISGVPLLGKVFGERPASRFVLPENQLGQLYRVGVETIFLDMRDQPARSAALYLGRPIRVLTRAPSRGVVELSISAAFEEAEGDPESLLAGRYGQASLIGGGYDMDGRRLLLSPPHRALFGFRF